MCVCGVVPCPIHAQGMLANKKKTAGMKGATYCVGHEILEPRLPFPDASRPSFRNSCSPKQTKTRVESNYNACNILYTKYLAIWGLSLTSLDASAKHNFLVRLEQLDLLEGLEVGRKRVHRRGHGRRGKRHRGSVYDRSGRAGNGDRAASCSRWRWFLLSVGGGRSSLLVALSPEPLRGRRVCHRPCARPRRRRRRRCCPRLLSCLRLLLMLLLRMRAVRRSPDSGQGRLVSIRC